MSYLDAFDESLIEDKDKLVQMGVIQTSKNQALLVKDLNNVQERGKNKGTETKNIDSKPKEKQKHSDGASGSKKKNEKDLMKTYKEKGCDFILTFQKHSNTTNLYFHFNIHKLYSFTLDYIPHEV